MNLHIHNFLIDLDIAGDAERDDIRIECSISPVLYISVGGVVLVACVAAMWLLRFAY